MPTILIPGICLFLLTSFCCAESVKLTTASNKIANAEYLQGSNNASPVLLLHSFMQTKEFTTVSHLATSLHDAGFTVLSPTLSLGINNRKQSLSCEAIHTHSLDSDADELKQWINWLNNKTQKPITLIGHSSGGTVILKYMDDNHAELVQHSILISMTYYGSGPVASETPELAKTAAKAIKHNSNPLGDYALRYCKTYPTYASAFLSYYNWNLEKTINVITKFNDNVTLIIGAADKRFDNSWLQRPDAKNSNIVTIEGASHFFDRVYELDLLDRVEELLANTNGR
ncbi:MAG: alpha/beta hydrolase [Gammaproteobacteria bacterium]